MSHTRISIATLFVLALGSTTATAGGYFVGEQGTEAAGRGGAFTAKADDPSAVELNPAGLAKQRGTTIYLGNRFAHVNEQFTRAPTLDWGHPSGGVPPYVEFDTVENANKWQGLDPMFVVATDFCQKDWGFALGAYAPPGIAKAKFPMNGGQRYMMTERDVKILNYTASVAWKHNDKFGIGATLQWIDLASMKFSLVVDGNVLGADASPVHSVTDIGATLEGADHFSMTTIIGAWYKPTPAFEIAFSGRVIPVTMVADTTIDVAMISEELDTAYDTEITLVREGQLANDVTLTLPLPVAFHLGFRYIHLKGDKEKFDIEFDIGMEAWSYVDKFEMDGNGIIAHTNLGANPSLDSIIMNKQWQNVYTFRLGGDVNVIPDRLTLRSGVFYETPAAKKPYANVDFFSSHQIGASLGASVKISKLELALAYNYVYLMPFDISEGEGKVYQQVPGTSCEAPYTALNCYDSYLGQPAPTVNAGSYNAEYHFLSLTAMYTF